jgi:hypothetical protein
LVPSCDASTNPADIVGYESAIVRNERARSRTVIIDTPPALIANDASELMHNADSVVLVARCGATTVASARRTADLVARMRAEVVGIVLLGTDRETVDDYYYRKQPSRRALRGSRRVEQVEPGRALSETPREPPAPAPPRVDPNEAWPMASPAPAATTGAAQPTDDGGIWRAKGVIDLSGRDRRQPTEGASTRETSTRAPRTTIGDGFPSRHTLGASGGPADIDEPSPPAAHAGNGSRGRLPLFRVGDARGNGNGYGDGQPR